jgi:hypothetical protein
VIFIRHFAELRKSSPGATMSVHLIFQPEVVEQRFRAVVSPHHDQQASDDRNQTEHGRMLLKSIHRSLCDAIYSCVAAFALKMPLKLSRYCRKTKIHNTEATRAGAMVPGDIVR